MVNAVVDTNVIVAGILTSSGTSASRRLIDRHRNGDFVLLLSPSVLLEIQDVLGLSHLRQLHQLTDQDIRRFCRSLEVDSHSRVFSGTTQVSSAMTRDVTDTKWIALAIEADADFLVTNDRRHLHRLRRVGRTRIVTPHKFLLELDRIVS